MRDNITAARPMDIYVDARGKLWRVVSVCHEPTVVVEEVEGHLVDPHTPVVGLPNIGLGLGMIGNPRAHIQKNRLSGGIGGAIWAGFERILASAT